MSACAKRYKNKQLKVKDKVEQQKNRFALPDAVLLNVVITYVSYTEAENIFGLIAGPRKYMYTDIDRYLSLYVPNQPHGRIVKKVSCKEYTIENWINGLKHGTSIHKTEDKKIIENWHKGKLLFTVGLDYINGNVNAMYEYSTYFNQ